MSDLSLVEYGNKRSGTAWEWFSVDVWEGFAKADDVTGY